MGNLSGYISLDMKIILYEKHAGGAIFLEINRRKNSPARRSPSSHRTTLNCFEPSSTIPKRTGNSATEIVETAEISGLNPFKGII